MSRVPKNYDPDNHYTYADLLQWDDSVRAEIINGNLYLPPVPLVIHQRVSGCLLIQFANFLEGKTFEVLPGPLGVRLFPKEDLSDDTVLEPDIVVICDPSKLDERGCNGPPDLIIEIVPPFNSRRDRLLKFKLYLKVKVRKYWIVHPDYKEIDVNILNGDRYTTETYAINGPDTKEDEKAEEIIPVNVYPDLRSM